MNKHFPVNQIHYKSTLVRFFQVKRKGNTQIIFLVDNEYRSTKN